MTVSTPSAAPTPPPVATGRPAPDRRRRSRSQAGDASLCHIVRDRDGVPLRVRIWRALTDRLCVEDLRTFCFILSLDFDVIPGDGKSAKARELVAYFARRNRLDALYDALRNFCPDVDPGESL